MSRGRTPYPSGSLPRSLPRALQALKKLEAVDVRLSENATPEQRELVFAARATILEVMLKPKRYSQMRLAAAAAIIDEVCGKLTDKLNVDGHQSIEVVIHEGSKKDPL